MSAFLKTYWPALLYLTTIASGFAALKVQSDMQAAQIASIQEEMSVMRNSVSTYREALVRIEERLVWIQKAILREDK